MKAHSRSRESGVPLGGIGAGKIEFCRDGRFTSITTNNNWDCPIIDGAAWTPPTPRILEGFKGSVEENAYRRRRMFSAEGAPGAWLGVYNPLDRARALKTDARKRFVTTSLEDIVYEGRFPRARVRYPGLKGVRLELEAFSGFSIPDDSDGYRDSSMPLALFAFTMENIQRVPIPVSVLFSWQNLNGVGGYAGTIIHVPEASLAPLFRSGEPVGLWFDHDTSSDADPRTLGNYSLRVWSDHPEVEVTRYAGWDPDGEGGEVWTPFARDGRLPDADGEAVAGALAARAPLLAPGEQAVVVFALAWYMPHLLAAETEWEHLVRPSSAPPMPISTHRPDYGHAYQNWFSDSWEVAGYGLERWQIIRNRIDAWQSALTGSSMPDLISDALCNDLFPLVSNTWLTRDGRYSVNEAPTDMNGCMGTMDQRAAGNALVVSAFPDLNRAELELFAVDQIRKDDDPRRYGLHWDTTTGRCERRIDRAGAILHDVGWDHLEGGRPGDAIWSSAHWPDLISVFILQIYQHGVWTGDGAWLDARYASVREALRFMARLDQDRDGVPDLWGPGSNTYDTELYPYFGASPFVATLYMAALRVGERMADRLDDAVFSAWCRERFDAARRVMEERLWDENLGYYIAWSDTHHRVWIGHLAHGERSVNCHISQLAGCWFADMLGLGALVDPARRRRALASIGRLNVGSVPGACANEYAPDGSYTESFTAYAMTYFAAQAIAAGLPDAGWEAAWRMAAARAENDSPWDAPLQMSGEGNRYPQWGRWYMSHPASWYVLSATGGVRINRLTGEMGVYPSWPSSWGNTLNIPVFFPGVHAQLNALQTEEVWEINFRLVRRAGEVTAFNILRARLPESFDADTLRIEVSGFSPTAIQVEDRGHIRIEETLALDRPGDGFTLTGRRTPA